MQKIISIIKEQKYFLILYLILFFLSSVLLLSYSKAQLHIASNQCYNSFFDTFFSFITYLGDGIVVIAIGIILLFFSIRNSLQVLISYAVSGILAQILKKSFFSGVLRPKGYFEGIYDLRLIQGIEIHTNNSFPSGHSVSSFALFFSLSLISKNKYLQGLFLALAATTAYSRVYLSQHFLVDITFGSLLGILIAFLYNYLQSGWSKSWLDKSITSINKK